MFNLTESLTSNIGIPLGSSFWSSSFLHGSNGHDYVIVSHILFNFGLAPSLYRASIIDVTDTSFYAQFEGFSNISSPYSDLGVLDATFPDYGFTAVKPAGPFESLRTWSAVPGLEFELTFELGSSVLLNGGLGVFRTNTTVNQWSMPAGRTEGWILAEGHNITVDTERSLTWFDRQWGGAPSSWTWFELHISNGQHNDLDIPMSIWIWKDVEGDKFLATVRESPGSQSVLRVMSFTASNRTYTSPASGLEYPLDWLLSLEDSTKLFVSSVRPDQELHAGGQYPTYEGYVTLTGTYKGRSAVGYGIVEIFP